MYWSLSREGARYFRCHQIWLCPRKRCLQPKLVSWIMRMLLLLRTRDAPTLSSTSKMPRFLVCQQTIQATSFSSPATLAAFSHQSLNSTRHKLCFISSPAILQRWLVPRMVLPSLKRPSLLASLSLSWLCTQCAMLRC